MSFGDAFGYPWKNTGKVFAFAMMYVVIYLIQMALTFVGGFGVGIWLGLLINLGFSLFLAGYMVDVIRHLAEVGEGTPDNNVSENFGRGIMLMLASFVYFLPVIIIGAFGFTQLGNPFAFSNDTAGANWLAFGLLLLILTIVSSWSLFVGMVRYAVENEIGVLFAIGSNVNTVTNNLGTCLSLSLHQFGLGLAWGLMGLVVGVIWGVLAFGMFNAPAWMTIIVFAIYQFAVMGLSVAGQLASSHLLTGFGISLGLIELDKPKNEFSFEPRYRNLGDLS